MIIYTLASANDFAQATFVLPSSRSAAVMARVGKCAPVDGLSTDRQPNPLEDALSLQQQHTCTHARRKLIRRTFSLFASDQFRGTQNLIDCLGISTPTMEAAKLFTKRAPFRPTPLLPVAETIEFLSRWPGAPSNEASKGGSSFSPTGDLRSLEAVWAQSNCDF